MTNTSLRFLPLEFFLFHWLSGILYWACFKLQSVPMCSVPQWNMHELLFRAAPAVNPYASFWGGCCSQVPQKHCLMSPPQFLSPFKAMDSPSPELTLALAVQHGVLASVALPPFCTFSSMAAKLTPRMVFLGNLYQMCNSVRSWIEFYQWILKIINESPHWEASATGDHFSNSMSNAIYDPLSSPQAPV